MTDFQEGRTYLWVLKENGDFNARIVTGDYDGASIMGDDGLWYSREYVVLLTGTTYAFASHYIARRKEWLAEMEFVARRVQEYELALLNIKETQ